MDMEGPRIPWNYESWESETCTLLWEVATLSEKTCKNWHFVCQDLSVSPKPSKNRGQHRIIRIPKSTLEKARILQQEHLPQRCCAAQRLNFHTSPLRNGYRFAWPTFWVKKLKGQNKTPKKNIPSYVFCQEKNLIIPSGTLWLCSNSPVGNFLATEFGTSIQEQKQSTNV